MKKIQLLTLLLLGMCMLQSCLHEDVDVFGKSVAERLNEAQMRYKKILTSATNGWRLEYIAGDTDATRRGMFNFLLKFEKEQVTASVDRLALSDIEPNADPYKKITSYYKLEQDMGISLSFDTYNSFLHYHHEQHGSYTTYKGDFEFTIIEANDKLITLRGKKYGNIIEMHRMPDKLGWEKFLENVNKIIDAFEIYNKFEVEQGGKVIALGSLNSNNRYIFSMKDGNKKFASNALYTQTGIKFVDSLSVGDKKVRNFDWNADKKVLTCTDASDILIRPILDSSYVHYKDYIGTYTMKYNSKASKKISKTVKIEQKVENKLFTLKGMTDFDVELVYDRKLGRISILNQNLGESVRKYVVKMVVWDTQKGVINYSIGPGMTNTVNVKSLKSGKIKFSFVDNGVWSTPYEAHGFVLFEFSSKKDHIAEQRVAEYSGPEGSRFYNIFMEKQ